MNGTSGAKNARCGPNDSVSWRGGTLRLRARRTDGGEADASRHYRHMPYPLIPETHLAALPDPERSLRFMVIRRRLGEARFSPRTREAYIHWIRRFIRFHGRRHPKDMAEAEVRAFLSSLAVEQGVAASTQNQALAALVFLYERVVQRRLRRVDGIATAKRPARLPVVLSIEEVRTLLAHLRNPARLCAALMYGGGLRVSECVSLRRKDVDFDRSENYRARRQRRQGSSDAAGPHVP